MKLFIDTSNSEKVVVDIDGERAEGNSKEQKAQKLLSVIKEVLDKKKSVITEISEIEINTGPGSFTGLRVGISVANTLGWALGVPVNGKNVGKTPIEPIYQ